MKQKKQTKVEPNQELPRPKKEKSDLTVRLISASVLFVFIFIYVGLAIIYTQSNWPYKEIAGWLNYFFTMVLIGMAMYELLMLMNIGNRKEWYLVAFGIFLVELLFFFPFDIRLSQPIYEYLQLGSWLYWYVVLIFIVVIAVALFLLGYLTTSSAKNGFLLLFYALLIGFGFKGFSIIALSLDPIFGFTTIIFVWGCIILTDSFAYFGGKRFGKHKMAPEVSPKKTWEGAAIGTTVAVVIVTLFGTLLFYLAADFAPFKPMLNQLFDTWEGLPGVLLVLLAILISIVGQLGDLAFSFLKRLYDKKDYSNLIPGHGGILDRFDSFILVFAVLYFITLPTNGGMIL